MSKTIKLNDGVQIPSVGFGTFLIPPDGSTYNAVREALDAGYRHIDTATAYYNEEEVGNAVRDSGIPREVVFITSKLWVSHFGYERAKIGIERSLKKLGMDYMDLYLLHQPYGDVNGAWKALEEAKAERDNDERPQFEPLRVNIEDYDTIYVGYPMWWYTLPMIMYTFFDTYDFSGKTIIPFNTHDGSGDGGTISELLHTIGDFERIGDHAINIAEISQEMNNEGAEFSDEAKADIITLFAALTEISELTVNAYTQNNISLAVKVEPLEEVIDELTSKIKHKHIERMQKGLCSPTLGVYLSNLLIFCERISDHYSNVAVVIIQTAHSNLYKHDYLNELRAERTPQFMENYNAYKRKYRMAEG